MSIVKLQSESFDTVVYFRLFGFLSGLIRHSCLNMLKLKYTFFRLLEILNMICRSVGIGYVQNHNEKVTAIVPHFHIYGQLYLKILFKNCP